MVRPGLLKAFNMLEKQTDFKRKTILEIGGEESFTLPKIMVEKGATKVIVSNIDERLNKSERNDRISTQYADALKLSEHFDDNTFNIIIGTAILEHIPNTPQLLDSLFSALRPGGHVLLSGAPIWSSAKGHHLWVKSSIGHLKFSDDDCPIEPWAHLINTAETMAKSLKEATDLTEDDISKITKWVFESKSLNRITSRDIRQAVKNSQFEILQENTGRSIPDKDLFVKAQACVPSDVDVRIHSLRYTLRKP